MPELFEYQKNSINLMATRKHNLLADLPGLGKTAQAIGLINKLRLRTAIVIVKASIKTNWKRQFERWLETPRVIQVVHKKSDFINELSEVIIINYELVSHSYIHAQLTNRTWDILICDEAHALKTLDSQRTKAILATNGLVHSTRRTLMMTGTPVLNRPVELYPMLKVLAPQVIHPYKDYYAFAKRYCDAWQDGFSLNVKGASHTDELNKKLRQHYMIRRTYEEVEYQLPKRSYEIRLIDITGSNGGGIKSLSSFNKRDFDYVSFEDTDGGRIATIRREIADRKIESIRDDIGDIINSRSKSVFFAYHTDCITRLQNIIGDSQCVTIDGSKSQKARDQAIQRFKEDPQIKAFIGQITAAGEGIDGLQEVCSHIEFIESSWVPGEIEQAIRRLHRIGQEKPVHVRFWICADTIEEHQMRIALDKVQVIKEIMR